MKWPVRSLAADGSWSVPRTSGGSTRASTARTADRTVRAAARATVTAVSARWSSQAVASAASR
ncbi:hypothetical protein ABZ490_33860 [Streptomyces sp. NPDC005811]|uniref:hypothetical protein n=1 Tax=Streptomyces sp. NPDC005811 TaxID=3154565 RepID=UPI0033CA9E4C